MDVAMTSHERFRRMYEHRDADRVPIIDSPWGATFERWHAEGLPTGVPWTEYFGIDSIASIWTDNSPRYPTRVIEQTDEYTISTTAWGVTLKQWRHIASTPEFIDFTIKGPDTWREAKARMTPSEDRIDWAGLARQYPKWREQGQWISGHLWFGFDITHSWTVGTERLLMALVEDPEWCVDMFNHQLDVGLALLEQAWDRGYTVDEIHWPDDMGYKLNQFFSLRTYRELLKPLHRRAADWAHARGVKVRLHSCGDIRPFVPELVEIGIDALNPIEVKAGMDPLALKAEWGDRLVLHGGINAVLWDDMEAIEAEMRRVMPALKASGGFIFSSDHSVPSSVSLAGFRHIVALAKELGAY